MGQKPYILWDVFLLWIVTYQPKRCACEWRIRRNTPEKSHRDSWSANPNAAISHDAAHAWRHARRRRLVGVSPDSRFLDASTWAYRAFSRFSSRPSLAPQKWNPHLAQMAETKADRRVKLFSYCVPDVAIAQPHCSMRTTQEWAIIAKSAPIVLLA